MSDDTSEIPQNSESPKESPLKSMFARWQKDPPVQHNIPDEVEQEMGQNEGQKSLETQEDIVKRLAKRFDTLLEEYTYEEFRMGGSYDEEAVKKKIDQRYGMTEILHGEDYMFLLSHQTKQGDHIAKEIIGFGPEDQFIKLELIPSVKVSFGKDHMPTATTQIGRVPVFFKGSDGKRYQAKNTYMLNPYNGASKKLEIIYLSGDDTYSGKDLSIDEKLPNVNFKLDDKYYIEREVPLLSGDFEQLSDILGRMEDGQITLGPQYSQ